ncbi:ATP-dependent helicase [Timonella sp. A28]|uniref:ATP-dependent helicase n=1 Tax=Timonella sp. A28 TaxID=3442640 RepID=UPI003EBA0778
MRNVKLLPPALSTPEHAEELPQLDSSQEAVCEALTHTTDHLVVTGAPGTGKTRLVLELVHRAISAGTPADRIVVLSASRRNAGDLRNDVTRLVSTPVQGTLVRTPAALAFSILTKRAIDEGNPPPRLITGPEQDQLLAAVLEGHTNGTLNPVAWPTSIPEETLRLRGFRAELRDVLMRAAENGLTAPDLARIGKEQQRPEWEAVAHVLEDYEDLTLYATLASDAGRRYDPAQIVDEAARELAHWDGQGKPTWDVVIVDDYQEATAATARLLTQLLRDGARAVLVGDPDVTVQGFRGAMPALLGRASAGNPRTLSISQEQLGQFGAQPFVLSTVWRGHAQRARDLRAVTQRATQAIAALSTVAHRTAQAHTAHEPLEHQEPQPRAQPAVDAVVAPSFALEEAHIARTLRAAHLRDNIAWNQMAVICRSGTELVRMRRALSAANVPVAVVGTDVPLRDEPAVRPLLQALKILNHDTLDIDDAIELLTSVIGGADAIGLRRIRRALRTEELRGGGGRTSDVLITEALSQPEHSASLGVVGLPLKKVATVLQRGREAHTQPGANAQTVLWAVWDATGLAEQWQRTALTGTIGAGRADRDLDAVLALFKAAETYVDRMPDADPLSFVRFIEAQDIPADSLAPQIATGGKVALLTPPGAAGREWELVVVAAVQEGTWPDLRLRDSLLGAHTLAEFLSGRIHTAQGINENARKEIYYDELRAFSLAVSRATRTLVVTAVSDTDTSPSPFLTFVADPTTNPTTGTAQHTNPAEHLPLDLRGLVALTRAELVSALENGDTHTATSRAQLLNFLGQQGIVEAQTHTWYGAQPVSSTNPLYENSERVTVSPSRIEAVDKCALRWTFETSGGTPASGLSQSVGTLIHAIAAAHPKGNLHEFKQELDQRWHELRLPDGWPARRQRELAEKMLEQLAHYIKTVPAHFTRIDVEQGFSTDIATAHITGIVDRLERADDGTTRIVDLKTGKTVPTKEKAQTNPQLGVYQLALLNDAFDAQLTSDGAELVYLAAQTVKPSIRTQDPITNPDDNWARDLVENAVTVMRSATFEATPHELCPTCPVRRSCPLNAEGQHVIPLGMPTQRPTQPEQPQHDTTQEKPQ